VGSGEIASFDCQIAQQTLLVGFLENVLFDGSLADQPEGKIRQLD
jgi:hypothetical protein